MNSIGVDVVTCNPYTAASVKRLCYMWAHVNLHSVNISVLNAVNIQVVLSQKPRIDYPGSRIHPCTALLYK